MTLTLTPFVVVPLAAALSDIKRKLPAAMEMVLGSATNCTVMHVLLPLMVVSPASVLVIVVFASPLLLVIAVAGSTTVLCNAFSLSICSLIVADIGNTGFPSSVKAMSSPLFRKQILLLLPMAESCDDRSTYCH